MTEKSGKPTTSTNIPTLDTAIAPKKKERAIDLNKIWARIDKAKEEHEKQALVEKKKDIERQLKLFEEEGLPSFYNCRDRKIKGQHELSTEQQPLQMNSDHNFEPHIVAQHKPIPTVPV